MLFFAFLKRDNGLRRLKIFPATILRSQRRLADFAFVNRVAGVPV